ncbi:hypothetical protein MMC09_005579 [Bachmanniomyces sp. S44760]|nr:hypothetical protein [Bachmanniomyces sp. S44760]
MSGQLLKQFVCQTRGISIVLADMVPSQGFYRPVEAVNSAIKNDVARKTEAAFKMPEMVPEKIKSRTDKLVITPLDKNKHATVSVLDESGDELGKFHVTDDPALQEPIRTSQKK